jgi:hypothetical protein
MISMGKLGLHLFDKHTTYQLSGFYQRFGADTAWSKVTNSPSFRTAVIRSISFCLDSGVASNTLSGLFWSLRRNRCLSFNSALGQSAHKVLLQE